jgi:hypothetical protein
MTTAALERTPETAPARGFQPHRVTLERYHRMIDAGVYGPNDRVVLWKGQLVEKMTKRQAHNNAIANLVAELFRIVPAGWHIRPEQPIVLSDDTEPETDITVIRGAINDYPDRPPTARDVVIVIEAADSSLSVDGGEVLEAYALNKIPCYWIVSIPDRQVLVHTKPEGGRYTVKDSFGVDGVVPVILDSREVGRVAVKDHLP